MNPSFHFNVDSQGNRIYDDPIVNRAYINLNRLSDFVYKCQDKTDSEYAYICQNINTDGNTTTTSDFLVNLLVGGFEFMGDIEFPWVGKTGGKIAGWILSALVESWRSAPPPSLQNDFNNVWNGTKAAYEETKLNIDTWAYNLNLTIWKKQFVCPKTKEIVTISQLGTIDFLPDDNDPQSDIGAIAVAKKCDYMINQILVPTRWKFSNVDNGDWWNCYYTRWNDSHPYDGPFYDGLTTQYLLGMYTSFPDIDIVDAQEKANFYVYFTKEYAENYIHNWFSNDRLYKGTNYRKWNLINRNDGGTAPDSFIAYLFNDGPGGNSKSGISSRDDVFTNWNMK